MREEATRQYVKEINRKIKSGSTFFIEHRFFPGRVCLIMKVRTRKGVLIGLREKTGRWVSLDHAELQEVG